MHSDHEYKIRQSINGIQMIGRSGRHIDKQGNKEGMKREEKRRDEKRREEKRRE